MTYDQNNVFAKIIRGEIPCDKVFEDDTAMAFRDINPQSPIHILVVPKGPYMSMDDFSTNASAKEITGFIRAIGTVAREHVSVEEGYRILANTGRDARQEVPHLHVHILGGKDLGRLVQ